MLLGKNMKTGLRLVKQINRENSTKTILHLLNIRMVERAYRVPLSVRPSPSASEMALAICVFKFFRRLQFAFKFFRGAGGGGHLCPLHTFLVYLKLENSNYAFSLMRLGIRSNELDN